MRNSQGGQYLPLLQLPDRLQLCWDASRLLRTGLGHPALADPLVGSLAVAAHAKVRLHNTMAWSIMIPASSRQTPATMLPVLSSSFLHDA